MSSAVSKTELSVHAKGPHFTPRSRPTLRIEDSGVIYDSSQGAADQRISAFTSLLCTREGTLLCAFQVGPAKHAPTSTIRLCRSYDQGRSWELLPTKFATRWQGVPGSLASGELIEVAPRKLLLIATWFNRSDPARPLFDPTTQGVLPSCQLKAFSYDDGTSWTDWDEIATPGLTGCSSTGPILQWADGSLAYPFESFKEYDDPLPGQHSAWLMVSKDQGQTFAQPILVARCPENKVYFWDQRLCVGHQPGEFIGMFWTHDLAKKTDLPVHACRATLNDGQVVDAVRWATPIRGQIAAPLLHRNGHWLAFVVQRARPATLTLWSSRDGGTDWSAENSLVIYEHVERAQLSQGSADIDFAAYWEDMGKWTFGHPAIRAIDDEHLLLAYYAGTPQSTSIHWTRIRVDE